MSSTSYYFIKKPLEHNTQQSSSILIFAFHSFFKTCIKFVKCIKNVHLFNEVNNQLKLSLCKLKFCFRVDAYQIVRQYKYDMWLTSILGFTRSN